MTTYETPSAKVIVLDLTAIICLSPGNPDADSSTERLQGDEFEW